MGRIVVAVLLVLLLVFSLSFGVLNAEAVKLNYYIVSFEAPLSIVVAVAFALGAIIGVAVCGLRLLSHKREIARLKRSVKLAEQEVENLRSIPIKDTH